ncbi:MAG: F0F1 ATP synthase subunit A [Nitrospirota bacterium]
MNISPDSVVLWQVGPFAVNATIAFTWAIMALLTAGSWAVTRRLSTGTEMSRWQNAVEVLVSGMTGQIREVSRQNPERYLPLVGTLFVFIVVSNLLAVVPGYQPPTGSLSTTSALAICVFVAVPYYGVRERGLAGYLKLYVKPTPLMLPFNIVGEISRTFALAVRLFGNIMSGKMIGAILLLVVPLLFPVVMQVLGLLIGLIQAYIFAVLAMVYIASGTRAHQLKEREEGDAPREEDEEKEGG